MNESESADFLGGYVEERSQSKVEAFKSSSSESLSVKTVMLETDQNVGGFKPFWKTKDGIASLCDITEGLFFSTNCVIKQQQQ